MPLNSPPVSPQLSKGELHSLSVRIKSTRLYFYALIVASLGYGVHTCVNTRQLSEDRRFFTLYSPISPLPHTSASTDNSINGDVLIGTHPSVNCAWLNQSSCAVKLSLPQDVQERLTKLEIKFKQTVKTKSLDGVAVPILAERDNLLLSHRISASWTTHYIDNRIEYIFQYTKND